MTVTLPVLALLLPLCLLVALYVAWPLLRGAPAAAGTADDGAVVDDVNLRVVAERRRQLDLELAALPAGSPERDRIIREFTAAARADLSRPDAVGTDVPRPDRTAAPAPGHGSAQAPSTTRWRRPLAFATVALLAAGPLLMYALRGRPDSALASFGLGPVAALRAPGAAAGPGGARTGGAPGAATAGADGAAAELPGDADGDGEFSVDEIETMVAQLEQRLQQDPSLVDGWLLLGRTRMGLGDLNRAIDAFEQGMRHDTRDRSLAAQLRVDLADALARRADAKLAGRPMELIREALELDGGNLKALGLAGAYAITQGRRDEALRYWEPMLERLPADSPQRAQIAAMVTQMRDGRLPGPHRNDAKPESGPQAGAQARSDGPGGSAGSAGSTGSTGPAGGGAAATQPAPAQAAVTASIDVDPALRGTVAALGQGGAHMFVVARRLDDGGAPAGPPAAAVRLPVPDAWPAQVRLGTAEAMMPRAALRPGERVRIVVRISASGNAGRASGDVEGGSDVVTAAAEAGAGTGDAVAVVLNRAVP